jgi:hypothetical protein
MYIGIAGRKVSNVVQATQELKLSRLGELEGTSWRVGCWQVKVVTPVAER